MQTDFLSRCLHSHKIEKKNCITDNVGYPSRKDLLSLPISVNSFLVIRQYAFRHHDAQPFYKLISDYLDQIPIWELNNILLAARMLLADEAYNQLVKMIFVH